MSKVKKMSVMGAFVAISFVVTVLSKLLPPVFSLTPFLTLDFKDAFVAVIGFMYGPLYALAVTVIEALVEMFTISGTGIIGLIMNILSTSAFAVVGGVIYSFKRTIKGAVIGLICGVIAMVITMTLWNYIFTPMYMGVERQMIVHLLAPAIIPFNIIKGVLNSALTLLLYKRIVVILSKMGVLPKFESNGVSKTSIVTAAVSLAIIVICVIIILLI